MFLTNLLRSIVFAIASAVLIFSQDHSVQLGATVLLIVTASVGFIGLAVLIRNESKQSCIKSVRLYCELNYRDVFTNHKWIFGIAE